MKVSAVFVFIEGVSSGFTDCRYLPLSAAVFSMLKFLFVIKHSFPVHLLQVVSAAEFFGRKIGQRPDLVVL